MDEMEISQLPISDNMLRKPPAARAFGSDSGPPEWDRRSQGRTHVSSLRLLMTDPTRYSLRLSISSPVSTPSAVASFRTVEGFAVRCPFSITVIVLCETALRSANSRTVSG